MVAALLPTDLCRLVVVQVYGSSLGLWSQFSLHCSLETSHRHSFLLRDRERRGWRDGRSSAAGTCVVYRSSLVLCQQQFSSMLVWFSSILWWQCRLAHVSLLESSLSAVGQQQFSSMVVVQFYDKQVTDSDRVQVSSSLVLCQQCRLAHVSLRQVRTQHIRIHTYIHTYTSPLDLRLKLSFARAVTWT